MKVPDDDDIALPPDPVIEVFKKDIDRTLLRENLKRTVDERLSALLSMAALVDELRAAARKAR